jgi:hypothetical protein
LDFEDKARALERMTERMGREGEVLPFRWGYFQGAVVIPWSLFLILGAILDLKKFRQDPWYISVIIIVIGLVGLPLGVGLLQKRKFALTLVYVTFGLTLLLVAIKIPVAILHYRSEGDIGSALPEAELLLVWLGSMVYYRKRQTQFR